MTENTADTHKICWRCLPRELQDMILERCTWHSHNEANLLAGSHQLAILSTVCRDWEDFYGGKVFQQMTLKTVADIQTFAKLVQGRRRAYVKWIWLRVELPMYNCEQCHHLDTPEEIGAQKAAFTNLVWNLFDILSKWKKEDVRRDGITLELSAHSPSDAHHFNKDLRFRLHDTAWYRWDDRPITPHNDPFHGWKNGRKIKDIHKYAKARLLGFGLRFDYNLRCVRRLRMRLPKVSVVTSFVIRRQFPRFFRARKSLVPIIHSLTRLSDFSYEPWKGPTSDSMRFEAAQNAYLVQEVLTARRRTLKRMSIFESHDESFSRSRPNGMPRSTRKAWLSWALARCSHHLEELYVSNNVDAYTFFYAFHPKSPPTRRRWMVWKSLKRLSLTTALLMPETGFSDLLILMAAQAAQRMPQLQIMELWSYDRKTDVACVFRFRREETEASIEFIGPWPGCLTFSAATKAAWGRVATAHRPLPLRWKESSWGTGEIRGEYSVLSKLELVEHMLHPVSLRQIAREDQRRREGRLT